MSDPKIKPCPTCKSDGRLGVNTYDNGWRHVECDGCGYMGPGEGSIRQAIKSHNAKAAVSAAGQPEGGGA